MVNMKKIFRYVTPFLLCLQLFLPCNGQVKSTGIPYIRNYSRTQYRASTQNWAVTQDSRGFMYFANNDGILEYDGTNWILHQFGEPAITRSLAADNKGNLYAGMYNEFGSVKHDVSGKFVFTSFRKSLSHIPGDLGDIWRVHVTPQGIFFQSYTHLFLFDESGKLLHEVASAGNFRFSFYVNGRIYIQEPGKDLLWFHNGMLEPMPGLGLLHDKEIRSILPGQGNSLIIGTHKDGAYHYDGEKLIPWTTPANLILKENQIFSSCLIDESTLAFGTIRGGVVLTTRKGEMIQHLDKNNGLQNNTVLSIFTDQAANLWMGLDNGIDYAEINSPVSFLHRSGGFGAGYAVAIHRNTLYLGTNNGLFAAPWPPIPGEQQSFTLIPNTVGQIWYLGVHNGILLCGHDNGAYQVNGLSVKQISSVPGAWKFIELSHLPGKLIGGTYNGLTVYTHDPVTESWRFERSIPGFSVSSRIMEEDNDGNLWMTHGFKGAFRIRLDDRAETIVSTRFYDSGDGFVTNNYINVYKIDGKPVFTAREGIFRYNAANDSFEQDTLLEKLFDTKEHIAYIRQDENRNIWFVAGNKPGVLRYTEDGSYSLVKTPYEIIHNQMIGGFESIYPYSGEHVFFGLENGFAHYAPGALKPRNIPFRVFIRKFEALENDTVLYGGDSSPGINISRKSIPGFPYHNNSFRISFSAPGFEGRKQMEYSYLLENESEKWSEWSAASSCEFNKLREGLYIFRVRAKDSMDRISIADLITFRVNPPWYRSHLAKVFYVVLLLLTVFLFYRLMIKRIEVSRRKERLRQLKAYRSREQNYQREALISEKEIVNLRNEKLQESMIHRDKELANQTLHLVRKNRFLSKLKEELKHLETQTPDQNLKTRLSLQIRRIDREIDDTKQWEVFETAFDEVHEAFLERIKQKFPQLTPREMRLCAYLKMNISTKEIASLMNISVRGVEISRYRLRKKMGIDHDTNLISFITGL